MKCDWTPSWWENRTCCRRRQSSVAHRPRPQLRGPRYYDGFADAASIVGFLGDVVDTVFADAECGDGVCSRPEEYPSWLPGGDDGAARAFDPCRADCGELNASALVYARVTFADTEKLANAHEAWAAFSDAGYNGYTPSSWGVDAQARVAGWNVCARDKREYGYLVSVCVFDGHGDGGAFIDGLPYRTTELACATSAVAGKHGTTYSASCPGGAAPALALFEGNWELRVDFSGWEMNALFDLAYPAVGGYLQFQRAPSAAVTFRPQLRGPFPAQESMRFSRTCHEAPPLPRAQAAARRAQLGLCHWRSLSQIA